MPCRNAEFIKATAVSLNRLAAHFPVWSENSTGMLQHVIWTALAAEGLGASLQVCHHILNGMKTNSPLHIESYSTMARTRRKLLIAFTRNGNCPLRGRCATNPTFHAHPQLTKRISNGQSTAMMPFGVPIKEAVKPKTFLPIETRVAVFVETR